MRPLLAIAIVLAGAVTARARPAFLGGDSPPHAGTPHPAVVRVIVADRDGMSLGSGALVAVGGSLGLVVTNWHVVRDAAGQIVVTFPDGFRSGATVLATDRDWDLAALAIWRPRVEPIPLAAHAPQPGEPLTIAGYGSGRYRAATGRCTQYVAPGEKFPYEMVELSAGAREGDSGGPIFNNRGELAGVLFGAAWGRTTGSYCGRVRQFLASVSSDFQRLDAGSSTGSTMIAHQHPPAGATAASAAARAGQPFPSAQINTAQSFLPSRPDFASPSRGTNISDDSAGTRDRLPVVSIPPPAAIAGTPRVPQPDGPLHGAAWTGSTSGTPLPAGTLPQPDSQVEPVPLEASQPLRWEDLAGETRTEQLKTVLAAVGVLAILFHSLRLLSPRES